MQVAEMVVLLVEKGFGFGCLVGLEYPVEYSVRYSYHPAYHKCYDRLPKNVIKKSLLPYEPVF